MNTIRKRLISFLSAAVGGATGAKIGNKMDLRANEIEKTVPHAMVERVGEGINVEFCSNILFGSDTWALSADAKISLDKLGAILNTFADTDIKVQGYANDKGNEALNLSLSQKYVDSVIAYLTAKGIADSRVKAEGFGETALKYDNTTERGRSQNCRVEFLITANQKMKAEAKKEIAN